MKFDIREMTLDDYDEVYTLWKRTLGIGLSSADSRENIARYLERNPAMSFVARYRLDVVGVALCGHDGRRGYLHHLAVARSVRRKGLARQLVDRCLDALRAAGIEKCHCFIYEENGSAERFWRGIGWFDRADLRMMSRPLTARAAEDDRARR
jgi:putative acetyltransferase